MPSSRAVLADIHEFGLDPKKPHVTKGIGRLAPGQSAISLSVELVIDEPVKEEPITTAAFVESQDDVSEVIVEEAKVDVVEVKEEPAKKSRGFQKKVQPPVS